MRLNFIVGATNGSSSGGQGSYQAVAVTLQLIKELVFHKGQCPFGMELYSLPSGKTALSQGSWPGLQIDLTICLRPSLLQERRQHSPTTTTIL